MIIIAGYSHYKDTVERDAAVAAFAEMVGRARQVDGCVDMAITSDAVDPERSISSNAGATKRHGRPGARLRKPRGSRSGPRKIR